MNDDESEDLSIIERLLKLQGSEQCINILEALSLPTTINSEDAQSALTALDQSIDLMTEGRHIDALPYIQLSENVLNYSRNHDLRELVSALSAFCDGISKMLHGDMYGSKPLFNKAIAIFANLSLSNPELRQLVISSKVACSINLARIELFFGNIEKAECYFGNVCDQNEQLLNITDFKSDTSNKVLCQINGTYLEFQIMFSILDLQVLDFDQLEKRIKAS